MKILIDFLKFWNFPYTIQEHSLPAAESAILTLPDRVLHYDETIEALVKSWSTFWKLWDFIKISLFSLFRSSSHLEPYFAYSSHLESVTSSSFTPHTISASRWILAKLLRSQSTHQSRQVSTLAKSTPQSEQNQEMTFAFVPADQFIQTKVTKWKKWNFENKDLWEQFRDDFEEWTKTTFKKATIDVLRALRAYLRERDVRVIKHKRKTIAKSLHDVLQKETKTPWIEEEIKRCILTEHFTSYRIELLLETDFDRKPKDYSWQAAKRRQSISPRFPKFFQIPQNPFRRQPSPISSLSDEQSGGQPDEQSENQSTGRQSSLTTENLEHSDGPSVESPDRPLDEPPVKPPVKPSVEPPVGPPDEPLVESSDGPSVEQSFKSSTPPPPSAHPSAPPTPANQPGG